MSLNKTQIAAEVAAIVQQVTLNSADKAKAQNEGKSAIDAVRTLASEVATEMPEQAKIVAAYLHAALLSAKVPKGSADPYKTAFTGYVNAVKEGVDITTGSGRERNEPMAASTAREFNLDRKEREERAALAEVKSNIATALKRATGVAMLQDILELIEDVVPAAVAAQPGGVETINPDSILEQLAA